MTGQDRWLRIKDPFYINSDDVEALLAVVRAGLARPFGQDPTIGAIRRLADLGVRDAIPLFRKALAHRNAAVKTSAALALQRFGHESEAIRALRGFLDDDECFVAAARTLAKIGTDEAIAALLVVRWRYRQYMFNGAPQSAKAIIESLLPNHRAERFSELATEPDETKTQPRTVRRPVW